MQFTNVFKLPEPFAKAIEDVVYHKKRQSQLEDYCRDHQLDVTKVKHFSISDLIRPPRMRVLSIRPTRSPSRWMVPPTWPGSRAETSITPDTSVVP